jgi:hypothetical protein
MELFLEGLYYVGLAIAAGSALCSVIVLVAVSYVQIVNWLQDKFAKRLEEKQ